MIRVTRRYPFSASHRLHSPRLSESENQEVYGKCNNPYGHGHDYLLEVSVRGPVDPVSGLALRVEALDELVHATVLSRVAHKNLNADVEEFRDLVPTTENLAAVIAHLLKGAWGNSFPGPWPRLDRVRMLETERNIFEVSAEE